MKTLELLVQYKRRWFPAFLLMVAAFLFVNCESAKEFDYWQYVDWEDPNDGDQMDMDAGMDGGDMDTDMETDTDSDTMEMDTD